MLIYIGPLSDTSLVWKWWAPGYSTHFSVFSKPQFQIAEWYLFKSYIGKNSITLMFHFKRDTHLKYNSSPGNDAVVQEQKNDGFIIHVNVYCRMGNIYMVKNLMVYRIRIYMFVL